MKNEDWSDFGVPKLTPNEAKEKLKIAQTKLKYANKILDEILKDEKEKKQIPDELLPIFDILKELIKNAEFDVSHLANAKINERE
ncbi:hypothetical protein AB7Z61_22380 [Providencia rettgeri]